MKLPGTFIELVDEAVSKSLYKELIKQLNKDFALANVEFDASSEILPTSLKVILHDTVFNLIQNKFGDYLNLLYVVDVSEERIKALDGSDTLKLSEQVSFLILQREWQKIWYKAAYS